MSNNKTSIPVVMAADNKYAYPMLITVASLLNNSEKTTSYDLYMLVGEDFSDENKSLILDFCNSYENCKACFIDMGNAYSDVAVFITNIYSPTYYRLKLSSLLPGIDKCIYLDTDVIVKKDLTELYSCDVDNYCLAGVRAIAYYSFPKETSKEYHSHRLRIPDMEHYVNAGVLLINLKKIREMGLESQFDDALKKAYASQDQDVLNVICYGHILNLPFKFNAMTKYPLSDNSLWERSSGLQKAVPKEEWDEGRLNPVIIHYADRIKPWNDVYSFMASHWWNELLRLDDKISRPIIEKYLINAALNGNHVDLSTTARMELHFSNEEVLDSIQLEPPSVFRKIYEQENPIPFYSCEIMNSPFDFSIQSDVGGTLEVRLKGAINNRYNERGERHPWWINYRKFFINGKDALRKCRLCSFSHPFTIKTVLQKNEKFKITVQWEDGNWGIHRIIRDNKRLDSSKKENEVFYNPHPFNFTPKTRFGRIVTWVPQKTLNGARCLKENGFKYTIRRFGMHITEKTSHDKNP